MSDNKSLAQAARAKKDEFYTRLEDIENELRHYKKFFAGKIVLCNCDDPYESEFFRYFAMYFNQLKLKRLITTSYGTSPVAGTERTVADKDGQLSLFAPAPDSRPAVPAYKVIINSSPARPDGGFPGRDEVDRLVNVPGNELGFLDGDGDFRSPECAALLDQVDVVVTNPPFSLFREYVAQLVEHNKKFLIIGSMNAVAYKEVFPLIMSNQLWLGIGFAGGNAYFNVSPSLRDNWAANVYDEKTGLVHFRNVCWYTNIEADASHRHDTLALWRHYRDDPSFFPKYDNYDAIEVSKVSDIPDDYDGVMGVPITFLDKYNPNQFEIIGLDRYTVPRKFLVGGRVAINGRPCYARILIRRKGA